MKTRRVRKSRKGPSASATGFRVGTKKRGNDGNIWKIVQTRKSKRWQLTGESDKTGKTGKSGTSGKSATKRNAPKLRGKTYFTHDNGGRPFMVHLDGKRADIYTHDKDIPSYERKLTPQDYKIHVKGFTVQEAFVGKHIKDVSESHLKPSFGNGNSILLRISKDKYVFIGNTVFEFQPSDEIKEYYSMVGNSDVPYPVAIGEKNVYFMIEDCCLSKEHFTDFPGKYSWGLDAYAKMYGHLDMPRFKGESQLSRMALRRKLSLRKHCKRIPKKRVIHARLW